MLLGLQIGYLVEEVAVAVAVVVVVVVEVVALDAVLGMDLGTGQVGVKGMVEEN